MELSVRENIPCLPYFSLAAGFLTGKYQPGVEVDSVRAEGMSDYMTERGWALLEALKQVAEMHNASMSATALGWLRAQPGVASPIASARTTEQLAQIMPIVELTSEQVAALNSI
jgi:aryl-alcohol dehydrogenase-like predicted oxidoreductase